MTQQLAPLRNQTEQQKPWEGSIIKKPWKYEVSVIIPVIDTYEPLALIIKLLKLQTVKPYILIIDTGSLPENREKIESLQDECTEVHSLRLNSVQHPSDFVAMACDLGANLCRSNYALYTHADCFPMKRDGVEELLNLCKQGNPVVGYRISPRKHEGWEKFFGHTWTMLDHKFYIKNRLSWNLRQFEHMYSLDNHFPDPSRPNYPDTEICLGILYQELGVEPLFIGDEENFKRNVNERFDHCRSVASGLLYNDTYYKIAETWLKDAMEKAEERINAWHGDVPI